MDVASGKLLWTYNSSEGISNLSLSPDGMEVIVDQRSQMTWLEVRTGKARIGKKTTFLNRPGLTP
jgi:hypothetical protein